MTPRSSHSRTPSAPAIALTAAAAMAVAFGIGRFAYTPLLPLMLQDGLVDLVGGSHLATGNYLGYLIGALLCMALPRSWPPAMLARIGLAVSVVLIVAMAAPVPWMWMPVRVIAGVDSAVVFIFTAAWCLPRLAAMGRTSWAALMFVGPGSGIALSGFIASGVVALGGASQMGWLVFGGLALVLSLLVWRGFDAPLLPMAAPAPSDPAVPSVDNPPLEKSTVEKSLGGMAEMGLFTLAYGFAGFGYIITATFLPVIARQTLPPSPWLDLFWPILGVGAVTGAILISRLAPRWSARILLVLCYCVQGAGVVLPVLWPGWGGFMLGAFLVGLPFTAINYLAMQDVRRLHPQHVARLMGLLTASYGIGQILGPVLVAALVGSGGQGGFSLALISAMAALLAGAALYAGMIRLWPEQRKASSPPRPGQG